ncbi:MAG: hypothetical protein HZA50_08785 [Planctomycetes bacterium]|nr:hypothetical protein [Planctomycetota bacterium]
MSGHGACRNSNARWGPWRWSAVAGLVFLAGMLTMQMWSSADARGQVATAAGGAKVLAIAGQITQNTYGLYLVDQENCTITAYQFVPGAGLKLLAARTYMFDMKLEDYNTEPSPYNIKERVEKAVRIKDAATKPQ